MTTNLEITFMAPNYTLVPELSKVVKYKSRIVKMTQVSFVYLKSAKISKSNKSKVLYFSVDHYTHYTKEFFKKVKSKMTQTSFVYLKSAIFSKSNKSKVLYFSLGLSTHYTKEFFTSEVSLG